jgi:Cytochrome C'
MKITIAICMLLGALSNTKKLKKPDYIPSSARAILDERMERHAEAAMRLSMSVVLLEYGDTWEVAQSIVDEPGIARPRTGDIDTINALLPPRFFEFQDQLKARAKELAEAAMQRNDTKLGAAYGKLTATCVACHSVYLNGAGNPPPTAK